MHGYPLFRALLLSVDFVFSAPPSYYIGIVREEHPVAKHDDLPSRLRGKAREQDQGKKKRRNKRATERKRQKEEEFTHLKRINVCDVCGHRHWLGTNICGGRERVMSRRCEYIRLQRRTTFQSADRTR